MLTDKNGIRINVELHTSMMLARAEKAQTKLDNGEAITKQDRKDIQKRITFLSPLRETKVQSNPFGRGTGMFGIETRCHLAI